MALFFFPPNFLATVSCRQHSKLDCIQQRVRTFSTLLQHLVIHTVGVKVKMLSGWKEVAESKLHSLQNCLLPQAFPSGSSSGSDISKVLLSLFDHCSHFQFSKSNQYCSFYLAQTSEDKRSSTTYCSKTFPITLCNVEFELHCTLLLSDSGRLTHLNIGALYFLGGTATMLEIFRMHKDLWI